jgi:hypothetical protein
MLTLMKQWYRLYRPFSLKLYQCPPKWRTADLFEIDFIDEMFSLQIVE